MKRITILVAALLVAARPAEGQSAIDLFVDDCSTGSTTQTVTDFCAINSGVAMQAYVSCVLPATTKPAFVRAVAVIDVQSSTSLLPDWWRADSCRTASFFVAGDPLMGGTCATLWDQTAPASVTFTPLPPSATGRLDRTRFLLTADLDPGAAYDLVGDGTTELSVFRLTVLNTKTLGDGSCAGCRTGTCIVLNEVHLEGLNDQPADWLRLATPGLGNHVVFNADAPVCPASVPVRNRTWGALKALYR